MFDTDEPEEVILRYKASVMKAIIDNFGIDVDTTLVSEDEFEAKIIVCTSPTFYRWVFGFCDSIEIIGPNKVLECYQGMLKKALENIRD